MEFTVSKVKELTREAALEKLNAFIDREQSKRENIEESSSIDASSSSSDTRVQDDVLHRLQRVSESLAIN
jgi:hypothetical protein